MIACQVHRTLEVKFGGDYAFNKEIGDYLTMYFYRTVEYYDWNDRLKPGTGKQLDVDAYLEYYKIK